MAEYIQLDSDVEKKLKFGPNNKTFRIKTKSIIFSLYQNALEQEINFMLFLTLTYFAEGNRSNLSLLKILRFIGKIKSKQKFVLTIHHFTKIKLFQ